MSDAKVATADLGSDGGKSTKIMMGLLGLNIIVILAVVIVLFIGQKKQAQTQTLDQVAQGASAGGEHGAAAAGGEHGAAGGEHGAGGGSPGSSNLASLKNDIRFFSVGDFTANLSGPASANYVKVNVNFEYDKDVDEEELKLRKPQFRDKIISLLNSKKPADLQNLEGRNHLKEELKTVLNGSLSKGKIEGVYFSTFIIN